MGRVSKQLPPHPASPCRPSDPAAAGGQQRPGAAARRQRMERTEPALGVPWAPAAEPWEAVPASVSPASCPPSPLPQPPPKDVPLGVPPAGERELQRMCLRCPHLQLLLAPHSLFVLHTGQQRAVVTVGSLRCWFLSVLHHLLTAHVSNSLRGYHAPSSPEPPLSALPGSLVWRGSRAPG